MEFAFLNTEFGRFEGREHVFSGHQGARKGVSPVQFISNALPKQRKTRAQ